jgi:hypothetical protein
MDPYLDYNQSPPPPDFSSEDAAWLEALLSSGSEA